jgi:7,8-dihydro-6-hydroxymethylpterin dimethyltransferase
MQAGLNDDECGKIIEFALQQKCVRGVTFQPIQIAGRNDEDAPDNRITLTDVRNKILEQTDVFQSNDISPVPCNPDAIAMGYVLKLGQNHFPLTRYLDPQELLNNNSRNTIIYEQDENLKGQLIKIFSTGISVDKVNDDVHQLLCCLPDVYAPGLKYDNLFRIIIMNFMDAYDFDVRAVKKSCVHIVNKDGKLIPFENMNLFYRDEKIKILEKLISE